MSEIVELPEDPNDAANEALRILAAEMAELEARRRKILEEKQAAADKIKELGTTKRQKAQAAAQAKRQQELQAQYDAFKQTVASLAQPLDADIKVFLAEAQDAFRLLASVKDAQLSLQARCDALAHDVGRQASGFSELFPDRQSLINDLTTLITSLVEPNLTPEIDHPAAHAVRRDLRWNRVTSTQNVSRAVTRGLVP